MKRAGLVGIVMLAALTCIAATALGADPSYRAYVDPETGKLAAPPPEEENAGAAEAAQPEEPVVEPGKTEAGGIMVDLRGRMTYTLQATLGDDGKVETNCIEEKLP